MLARSRRRRSPAARPGPLALAAFAGGALAVAAAAAPGPAAAATGAGGAFSSAAPVVKKIRCRRHCRAGAIAAPGSRLRIRGRHLAGAQTVVFLGSAATGDEAAAPARHAQARRLDVKVPARARSGRVAVVSADGARSKPSRQTVLVDAPPTPPAPQPGQLVSTAVNVRRAFYAGPQAATLGYEVGGSRAAYVAVQLVREKDGKAVKSWPAKLVQPGVVESRRWKGTVKGRVQRTGDYAFRVTAVPAGAAQSAASPGSGARPARARQGFVFARDEFPIRGRHRIDMGAGRFGTPRAGHTHQGQDVFAKCGTPLVAARGGVVKHVGWQSAAGNYLVIDAAGTGRDYVYMHMAHPPLVREGEQVYTGEPIGEVGDTGDAQGCHLHFELWTAPGWYTGGHPIDPLHALRAWDRVS